MPPGFMTVLAVNMVFLRHFIVSNCHKYDKKTVNVTFLFYGVLDLIPKQSALTGKIRKSDKCKSLFYHSSKTNIHTGNFCLFTTQI